MDGNTTKKYLTNSDKSVYNLQWQLGAIEKSKPRQNKHSNQYDTNRNQNSPRRSERNYIPENQMNRQPISREQRQHEAYNYPYAYPPTHADRHQTMADSQNTDKIITARRIKVKQSDRAVNLLRKPDRMRVVHHYVDSPTEADKLVTELQRKGYVQADDDIIDTYVR